MALEQLSVRGRPVRDASISSAGSRARTICRRNTGGTAPAVHRSRAAAQCGGGRADRQLPLATTDYRNEGIQTCAVEQHPVRIDVLAVANCDLRLYLNRRKMVSHAIRPSGLTPRLT